MTDATDDEITPYKGRPNWTVRLMLRASPTAPTDDRKGAGEVPWKEDACDCLSGVGDPGDGRAMDQGSRQYLFGSAMLSTN
jgi:hypothetical protein